MMPTNPHDAFRGQSRSPIIVAFRMLGTVSSYAIVTLSSRRAGFHIFDFKNIVTLKYGSEATQGHCKWYHSIDWVLGVFFNNFCKYIDRFRKFSHQINLKRAPHSTLKLSTCLVTG